MKSIELEWASWYLRPVAVKNIYWARVFQPPVGFGTNYIAEIITFPADDNGKVESIYLDEELGIEFETVEDAMTAIEKKLGIATGSEYEALRPRFDGE
ncbi:MAG: hypothetical protein V3U75_12780 [Methylococcaceae bacterium]